MKTNLYKVTKFTASLLLLLICGNVFSQAPQKMSYQAVIRNNSNVLVTSSPIGMKISILQGSSSGTAVYVETQTAKTNVNGLVSIEIGSGTVVTGTFAGINWGAGPYFVKTETDPKGGTAYSIAGTSQLMSVPYALFSANGAAGSQGPQGPIGLTGPAGATGPQGPAGRDGSMLADADATTKGKIQLAGDLGGSASAPTVPALANKVDKVDGKGLSTEDYTTTEKTKLAAITGTNTGDQDLSGLATTDTLDLKVDKVDGKGLSTNDYTTTEKTKLGAITGTNTGDETSSTIKSKLGITTLSGSNTGDQDLSGFATIASPSFTGTVITPASTTAGAGLRIPHGVAPTTAVNGDIWTTSSGLFANIDGAVKQYPTLSDRNNFTGNNTFSGTTLIFGNSTAFSTTNIGTGATEENATKTVNIATNGTSGSSTNVNIGPIDGGGTTTLGQSTGASTVNIGTGATLETLKKTVNIGTKGAPDSITEVKIGPEDGLGFITLGQSTAISTVNIGTGINPADIKKTVNIGTNGAAESLTEVKIGPTAGLGFITLGQSTAASTVNIGTGPTLESAIKTVNIGTNGVLNSTTNVNIGPTAGLGAVTLGQSTAASTVNIGTGATSNTFSKTVNIGTGGVAGSTTNTTIGTTSGGASNVTINGPTVVNNNATFTGLNVTIGNQAAAGTYAIGNGAITTGTKTVHIGTGGNSGSTTDIIVGTTGTGTSNTFIGPGTNASSVNIGTGATANTFTKTVNIGTGGVAGSTTNTTIGTTSGGANNVTINGPTNFLGPASFTGNQFTISATNPIIGNSTAASTIDIGTGATLASTIKNINIGTNGALNSTTNVNIGPALGLGTITLGQSTAASTVNIGTGATLASTTKNINIGTNGVANSTTNIAIGSATGTNAITINGPTTIGNTATFTGLNVTIGNQAATGVYGIGTGAITSGQSKTINIGTGGLASSTTTINLGTSAGTTTLAVESPTTFNNQVTFGNQTTNISATALVGGSFTIGGASQTGANTFGQSTKTGTTNIASGATESSLIKTVNIGTNGVSGSTTNVTIGSATGTSTTRINGSVQHTYTTTASALTLTASHRYVVVTAGVLITLPTASTVAGTVYTINARIAGVTISSYTNLAGSTGITTIANSTSITIISDGTNWQQVN